MVFNILEYGAKADGETLCTQAVQRAIDACHTAGGGTVFFPEGTFVLSTVFLKSDVRVELAEGACDDFQFIRVKNLQTK
jgi:polygalacturonase